MNALFALLAPLLLFGGGLAADEDTHAADEARHAAQRDRAALLAQQKAIETLSALLKKLRGNPDERDVAVRLMDAEEQAADLEFRIAHEAADRTKTPIVVTKYHQHLKGLIESASLVIKKYPNADGIVRILYARAQSFAELKMTSHALEDYEAVATRFPETGWATRANLALARYAIEARDHRKAILHLKRIEAKPESSQYPFALYRLAWAYFNLDEIDTGISYLRRQLDYYREKVAKSKTGKPTATDKAIREQTLRDYVTFYFEGVQKKKAGYALTSAVAAFQKLDPEAYLGPMLLKMAKLVASRERADDMTMWRDVIADRESARPETLEALGEIFEAFARTKHYDKLVPTARIFTSLAEKAGKETRGGENFANGVSQVVKGLETVQAAAASDKGNEMKLSAYQLLTSLYPMVTPLLAETDPRLTQIHYNLAETLFRTKSFEGATAEYGWLLAHWRPLPEITPADIKLKAIGSRYQTLLEKGLVPKDMKPAAVAGGAEPDLKRLDPAAAEWMGWVEAYIKEHGVKTPVVEEFEWETVRLLYGAGQTRAALARAVKFAEDRPKSPKAIAAASLVLDTNLFDKQWQSAAATSETFLKQQIGDPAFHRRLEGVPAEARYNALDALVRDTKLAEAMDQADEFMKLYPTSPRAPDCLFLGARAAQQLQDHRRSLHFLTSLLNRFPKSENRAAAVLARAGIEEAIYDFDGAAEDYLDYLAHPAPKAAPKMLEEVAGRALFAGWLAKQPKPPDCRHFDGTEALRRQCDRYRALVALGAGRLDGGSDIAKRSAKSADENRTVWAAAALTFGKELKSADRLSLALTLAGGWKDLDPLIQFSLVPVVNRVLPDAFIAGRKALPGLAPLKATSKAIVKRIGLIRELESAAGKALAVPWGRVKLTALTEVALAYEDFSNELSKLPPPKGLDADALAQYQKSVTDILDPFRAKGKTLRSQAVSMAGEFPIDPAELPGLSETPRVPTTKPEPIDLALLAQVEGEHATAPDALRSLWADSLKARAWSRVGFFYQEIRDKEKQRIGEPTLLVMRAISLAVAGAQPEALAELESARADLGPREKRVVGRVLHSQYLSSTAPAKAEAFASDLKEEGKP